MRFSCNQDTFSKVLNSVYKFIPTKSSLPILSSFLIYTENGQLAVSGNDIYSGIEIRFGVDVIEEGRIAVPAKVLVDFVNAIPSGVVNMNVEEGKLIVESGKYRADLSLMIAEDYPQLLDYSKSMEIASVAGSMLYRAVKHVAFAVSDDPARPLMMGIKLEIEDSEMALVGSNTVRLSRYAIQIDTSTNSKKSKKKSEDIATTDTGEIGEINFVVQGKVFEKFADVISEFDSLDGSDAVKVFYNDSKGQVVFSYKDIVVFNRIVEGVFPDYKARLPKEYNLKYTLSTQEVNNAMKVINGMARGGQSGKVGIYIDSNSNTLTFKIADSVIGSNQATVDISSIEGEVFDISCSYKFLVDSLSLVKADTVTFGMNDTASPIMISDSEEPTWLYITMPMR